MKPGQIGVPDVNLDKTYSVKSNAVRDMRKAIAKGELAADAQVVVVPSGYQIVLPYVAPPAKAVVTPQVPALNGMAPMGFVGAVRAVLAGAPVEETVKALIPSDHGDEAAPAKPQTLAELMIATRETFAPAKADALLNGNVGADPVKPAKAPKPAAAPQAEGKDYGLALTSALAKSKVWATLGLPLSERAGHWVHYEAVHDSDAPHGLTKGQMPATTGSARKRGLIEIAGTWEIGMPGPRKLAIRLTPAGLAAHQGSN
jgi:hypothetical protein